MILRPLHVRASRVVLNAPRICGSLPGMKPTRILVMTAPLLALSTCGPRPAQVEEPPGATATEARFQEAAEEYYRAYLDARPTRGVRLGHHEYDGLLPDLTPGAMEAERSRLEKACETFESIDTEELSTTGRVEHATLLTNARAELFRLEVLRLHRRNPMMYVRQLDLVPYIGRDYKPRDERIRSVIQLAGAAPAFLTRADENLEEALPRTWLETAIKQVRGTIPFVRDDVADALGDPSDPALDESLEGLAKALETFLAALEARLEHATDDYALGERDFLRYLADSQGLEYDIDTLEKMGREDLERNLAALKQAATQIDPEKTVAEVVQMVVDDKPDADKVLEEAEAQASQMRRFLIEKDIVTIPSEHVAEVRESPPYKRWNAASLDSAGPFEKKALPSYYYISPPDPDWPEDVQRAYIPGRSDLLFITIHELWPGHFLHSLHARKNPSRILKSFWSYAMGEGWAHYTEEMMWEAGAGDRDPRAHIGQLLNALLRNVRFVSAIGLHARGMSVEESAELFREKAFCDEGNARQQAVRGTFDPMYLSYTLGKLEILDLREAWKARTGEAYSLKAFHDAFLSYGGAPLPAIRRAMMEQ